MSSYTKERTQLCGEAIFGHARFDLLAKKSNGSHNALHSFVGKKRSIISWLQREKVFLVKQDMILSPGEAISSPCRVLGKALGCLLKGYLVTEDLDWFHPTC